MNPMAPDDAAPLIAHRHPDEPIAWRGGRGVSAGEFLADVRALAERLPRRRHLLNLCDDRYRFLVALGAALANGQITLLVPNRTQRLLDQVEEAYPDLACVAETAVPLVNGASIAYPEPLARRVVGWDVPRIPGAQTAAVVFTSGSTGRPVPHAKPWRALVAGARGAAETLGVPGGAAFLGTVPPQHMWGLEATVMLPLQTGGAVHACRPLFPADVAAWLAELPWRRVLVTTPLHIRACVEDSVALPGLDLILSAAAPLSETLAAAAEARYAARLIEIYGSTEAGMIAARRTAHTDTWRALPGVRVSAAPDGWAFEGGHIEGLAASNDVLEVVSEAEFRLAGRLADVVNVAGKRASLADLNRKLAEIPGVQDGAFHTREAESGKAARLMAFVVAPGLSEHAILEALRCSIDPVFLPRPLVKVPALPRAPTGKLPLAALRELEISAGER
ncbi:MAG: AMP-binding protein [Burkholderiales bacterium]